MKDFVNNTWNYLKEYYKRNLSENGFSVDKKVFGDTTSSPFIIQFTQSGTYKIKYVKWQQI